MVGDALRPSGTTVKVELGGTRAEYHSVKALAPDGVTIATQDWIPPGLDDSQESTHRRPELLLVHGFSQSSGCWWNQVTSALAQQCRIVTYDLRGHGDSEKPLEPVYYREANRWAGELQAVIEATGLVRPIVVAWSYSGRVILDYLSTFGSDRLSGLIMVNATSKAGADVLGPAIPLLRQMGDPDPEINVPATHALLNACVARPLPENEFAFMLDYNLRVPAQVRANMGGREANYGSTLQALRLPTLIVHGNRDPINLPAMADYTASQVRGARSLFYDDVAHMPFWEAPLRFNADVAHFIDNEIS